ncbi:protein SCO1 homolog 2, mitochondrial [Cornus florida]|uniref:protein SCO1 homolog 2, mitochondrial n=1 Tax=Cornus florida TaxID=4283 RepID=UPI0028A2C3B0|nr:protein SCO1 homolog 2, mitochondrial [Cornus florida]
MSRFLFSSLKNRSAETLNLLKRSGQSKRFHSSSYLRSARRTTIPTVTEPIPTSHSWRSYIIPTALLGGIGGALIFLHYNDERRAIPKGQGKDCQRCTNEGPIIGGPFSLIDTEGRLVTERNLRGNWVLLYFGYTSSPDIGPAEVQKMANAIDVLESKKNLKVLPVCVTIDPQRDNPSQLRAYLKEFDARIVGLTGPVAAIRQMAQQYRIFFRKVEEEGDDYLVESSHNMYLMNPNMEIVRCFGVEYNAEELSEAIVKELKKTGT